MQGRLTHAEECILCGRAQAGDDRARDRLVEEHMGLARMLARKAWTRGVDVEDLVQEAVIGMLHAVRMYAPARHPGVRFGTYAAKWIRRFVREAVLDRGLIHIPDHAHRMLDSPGGGADLAGPRREQREAAARVRAAEFGPIRGCEAVAPGDAGDDGEDLGAGLAALPMIQRHVVARLYGLDGGRAASLKRVAEEIGCSRWAVERIARAALDRLRAELSRRHERRRRECAYPEKCNPNRRKG